MHEKGQNIILKTLEITLLGKEPKGFYLEKAHLLDSAREA